MIRALLLDLDNTLLDRDAAYRLYVDDLLIRIAIDRDVGENLRAEVITHDRSGRCDRDEHCRWLASRLASVGWTAADFWQDQLDHLPRFIGRDPAVCDLLGQLNQRFTLAIVTNGSTVNQREKIRRAGLAGLIEHIVVSEEVGCEKPAKEIFLHALARLNCQPDEAIMVGDDLHNDILGAKSVGLRTVWIQAATTPDVDNMRTIGLRIGSLLELDGVLASLNHDSAG